jgi:inorganic phosphate transporter, PiT family
MFSIILLLCVCFVAYTNGANDNFKGVATLFGTGTTDFKKAITWATATTAAGSVASIFLAAEMVKNFSGKGLVPDDLIATPAFVIAISLGAAATVFTATKVGMPISTTHALVGALTGVGLVAVGSAFNFDKLGKNFFLPLILSPVLALTFSLILYLLFRFMREKSGIRKESCVCITPEVEVQTTQRAISLTQSPKMVINTEGCAEMYSGKIVGIDAQKVLDSLHFLSAGVVSFARGLNDTPKIVALMLSLSWLDIRLGMVLVALAMAIGGWLNARKVGETMSQKITKMNHGQGFTANLVTSLLVTTASYHGLPVSTTHVSVGSLFGIGTVTKTANVKTILNILLSWFLTLPTAAILSAIIYYFLK